MTIRGGADYGPDWTNKLTAKTKLLWMASEPVPPNLLEASKGRWDLVPYDPSRPLSGQLEQMALAVIYPNGQSNDPHWLGNLLSELDQAPAVGFFLLDKSAESIRKTLVRRGTSMLSASVDTSAEELSSRISAAAAVGPIVKRLFYDLSAARNISVKATKTLEQMDEEMRLAARLQRDFLPRRLPEVGPVRFGVLYRPATWVSGDIYDVVRLDETNVGFYVADVVGHGMPAALLTMFIKKALQTKRIVGNSYEIIPPDISLAELNTDINDQNLSSCQFCTAVYCVLNTDSMVLTLARGGHPEPMVIHENGQVERLWIEGTLLGVFPDATFKSMEYQLRRGDRLVLYSDGAEQALRTGAGGVLLPMERAMSNWAGMSREEMLLQLTALIDHRHAGVEDDDITIVVMDVEG